MSESKDIFCAILLAAAWFGGPAVSESASQESLEETAPRICALSGKVIDFDTGQPVPHFHLLYMEGNGGLIEHLETDANGRFHTTAPQGSERSFRLDRSRRGIYIIDWVQQARLSLRPFRGVVNKDMTEFVFKVKLWPVTKLVGRVVDASSQAVRNASVYVHSEVPPVQTDASGVFHLEVAPTDRDFDLFALSADGDQAGMVHLKAGATTATIPLKPTRSYRGRVIDMQGRPVGPFKFIVGLRLNGSRSDCWQQSLQADADGTFVIDRLHSKATYHLWWFPDEQVNHTIGEFGEKDIDLAQLESDESIDLVVAQYLNAITGTVLDVQRVPVERAKVMVHTRHGIQAQHRWGRAVFTDEDGRFRLENLTDGLALFHVYKKGCRTKYLWAPTDTADMEAVLRPSSEVGLCEVQVVDDAFRPVSKVPVRLDFAARDSSELLTSRTALTDAEGRVEFTVHDYGDDVRAYGTIRCDADGYDLAYGDVSDSSDAQVKLVLHESGPCWSGQLVDPQQKPVAGAKLYLTSMSQRVKTPQRTTVQSLGQSSFEDPCERTLVSRTDANGRFVLHRLDRKDFVRVAVKARGFKSEELDFSPEEDAGQILQADGVVTAEGHVFQLSPGVTVVEGVLIDSASGNSLPEALITFRRVDSHARRVRAEADGTFVIGDLEPGEYVPVIESVKDVGDWRYVCAPETLPAEAGQTMRVKLKAREGIVLKGRLIEAMTQQPPSADRAFVCARLRSGHTISTQRVAGDGTWELVLPPGPVDLYYSVFSQEMRRFLDSERPLSLNVEDREYEGFVLELNAQRCLSLRPTSLIGRPLPGLQGLTLFRPAPDLDNHEVLVCFFDVEQRPSRNRVLQLVGKAQTLMEDGVTVVLIQAAPIERERLDAWIGDNHIALPTGMIRANQEQTFRAWGVKSLPWLILTDVQHIVTGEGGRIEDVLGTATDARK